MYNHIQTSIIGSHSNIQDAIKYYEDDNRIIAVVADGLGSCKHSADGARLICRLVLDELKKAILPIESTKLLSPRLWYKYLQEKVARMDDYCTTCSFGVIDKIEKKISVGQIGDSPIFVNVDEGEITALRQEKDFSNITECLGGREIKTFAVYNSQFKLRCNLLISSDGIGDELDTESLDSMFSYLSNKYEGFTPKSRSRKFTKEIKATLGKVNHDDKSAIYIWSR